MISGDNNSLPNLLNTPGIYYAIAYWCSAVFYLTLAPNKYKGWKKWLIIVISGIVLGFFMTITYNKPIAYFIPLMLVTVLILFFIHWSVMDADLPSVTFYTIRAFAMGEFLASFEWQLFYYAVNGGILELNIISNFIVGIPVYILFFFISFVLERILNGNNGQFETNFKSVLGAVAIEISIYAMSNISFVLRNTPFSARYTNEILILRTTFAAGGMIIINMYYALLHYMKAQIEVKALQSLLEAQYSNYKTSRDSINLINQKYHDLKHQIAILRNESLGSGIIDGEEKNAYLDKMEKEIRHYEAQNKTGNDTLDVILNSKSLLCQSHHIEFTVVADGSAINFMDIMDISSLFGNALDNAIESVRKIDNYSKRLIHVTVVRQKSFARITVENTYKGNIIFKNGLPVTTKRNEDYHGFGVKSIRQTVEKYGGSMALSTKNNWFLLNILIPQR